MVKALAYDSIGREFDPRPFHVPFPFAARYDLGQVANTRRVPLSPSSIIWYRSRAIEET